MHKNASIIVELVKYLADKFNSIFYDYMNRRRSSEYSTSAINDDSSYVNLKFIVPCIILIVE
jgi:hypothetical protein